MKYKNPPLIVTVFIGACTLRPYSNLTLTKNVNLDGTMQDVYQAL